MSDQLKSRVLLGMLTPSSNTVLEPMTSAMLADLPDVTAHFSRLSVTEISLKENALKQFNIDPMLAAAKLLGDANVSVIAWNGTSASWRGFATDSRMKDMIFQSIGIPVASSVLGLNEALRLRNANRVGLVSPYIDDVQESIISNYRSIGIDIVAERHLGETDNFAFSEIDEGLIANLIREVADSKPEVITVLCTNMRGTRLAEPLEKELGIPIYDSIATALWHSLRLAGLETSRIKGWGSLFELA